MAQHVQLTYHHKGGRLLGPASGAQQRTSLGICPVGLARQVMLAKPEHLGRGQGGRELVGGPAGVGGGLCSVVRDGDHEQLGEEVGSWMRRCGQDGGAVAHDGCEVAAGGGAADGLFGHVEGEERRAEGLRPEDGFPGVVDGGGEGGFGTEAGRTD